VVAGVLDFYANRATIESMRMFIPLKNSVLRDFKSVPAVSIVAFVLSASCARQVRYIPDPVKHIDRWMDNFEQQMSFSYTYEMKTRFLLASASGECMIGKGERLKGYWDRGGKLQNFEYIGVGDIEYVRIDGDWEKSPRGEQSDVFTQIKRILTFGDFEYEGFDDSYLYRFRANVPFLAPDRRKEMIGSIRVSAENYLPEIIWAGLPDSSVYWQSRIFDYNEYKDIKPPIREYRHFYVHVNERARNDLYDVIERRLDLLELNYRLEPWQDRHLLSLPIQYELEDVQSILSPGGLNVYVVVDERESAERIAYLKNDMYAPVFVSDLLFTEGDVKDAEIKFDARSTPYIALRLHKRRRMPRAIGFEVDSVLVATTALDTLPEMDRINLYPEMQYHDLEILRALIKEPLGAIDISPASGEIR